MNQFVKCCSISAVLLLAVGVTVPTKSVAQESVTNGYICAPKNPGGEETRLYFRQQDGVAINLASNATFPVVCPVIIPFDNPPYEASVAFKNGSNATQNFACALEEYDAFANLVRSIGKSVSIPPGGSNLIAYQDIYLLAITNFLSLRCILPPRGMIGWVEWY